MSFGIVNRDASTKTNRPGNWQPWSTVNEHSKHGRHTAIGLVRAVLAVTVEITDPTLSDAASWMTAHELI